MDEFAYVKLQSTETKRVYYCFKIGTYTMTEAILQAARLAHKSRKDMICKYAKEGPETWEVMTRSGEWWCVTRDGK